MSEVNNTSDTQSQDTGQQRGRFNLPAGVGAIPHNITDPAMRERIMHAQAIARAQAQAVSTVFVATIVSLVTSAFTFVAALAWNSAIQQILNDNINGFFKEYHMPKGTVDLIYAVIVTIIAIIVVLIVQRFAGNLAKKSAIAAANG